MKTLTAFPPFANAPGAARKPNPALREASGRDIVDLGEAVVYHDPKTGRTRRVRLVLPQDVDPERGRISVHSPIGAALLGLGVDQIAEWQDRRGNRRSLRVVRIEDDLEPAGYLNV
jgi:transcription elongation GreA/GreB family factor